MLLSDQLPGATFWGQMQRAGIDPTSTDLAFVNPVGRIRPHVPTVELFEGPYPSSAHLSPEFPWGPLPDSGYWLSWHFDRDHHEVTPEPTECLREFVRLAGATSEAVLKFARKWGALGICRHGYPFTHTSRQNESWRGPAGSGRGCGPMQPPIASGIRGMWEPVEAWYHYASEALEMLTAMVYLGQGELASSESFRVSPQRDGKASTLFADHLRNQQFILTGKLTHWLDLSGLQPRAVWWPHAPVPHVQISALGIFAILAVQLAAALTSPLGLYLCDECQYPFEPPNGRRPRRDKRRYCPTCSPQIRLAAKRRWWNEHRSPQAQKQAQSKEHQMEAD
jgi:hypothetical protein